MSESSPSRKTDVVVIGGGVAGITAAVALADRGKRVTLIEARRQLGGRAGSTRDPETGQPIDNCQHVVMGCCKSLLRLYAILGVSDKIQWSHRFDFVHADGTHERLISDRLPRPLHTARSFLLMRCLSFSEKLGIGRALSAMRKLSIAERRKLNTMSFADWLAEQGQNLRAIERFWQVTIESACNEKLDCVAAGYAVQVFVDGLLAGRSASAMGVPTVPLSELYSPAENYLKKHHGELLFSRPVSQFLFDQNTNNISSVLLNNSEQFKAKSYIAALPFDQLRRVVAKEMQAADDRFNRLDQLKVSPILGIHLWVRSASGQGMALPHVVLTGSPIHWVFNKGDAEGGIQHLHAVVSAAHELEALPSPEVLDIAMKEVRRAVPGCRNVELVRGRVMRERRATFSIRPGVDELRPTTTGRISNLLLAGDWTATGWPATMEGAAISGFAAAEAVTNYRK